jgi:hypothetical protein
MWELKEPKPVRLIVGILACDERGLAEARALLELTFGPADLVSDIWPFEQTDYYRDQIGPQILRQFLSVEELIHPGDLADIKHRTNELERQLAATLGTSFSRPVNLDPGLIEPSKLVLATTKNYAHRIYIGKKMYAEVTLVFDKGAWHPLPYTYPDYHRPEYADFFSAVRDKLVQQLRSMTREK